MCNDSHGDRRPDLGLVIPSFRGGGAEGTMVRLANCLVNRGLAIDVVVLDGRGPWHALLDPRVRLVDLRTLRVRFAMLPLANYMRNGRPHAILVGPSHLSVAVVLARRLANSRAFLLLIEHNDLRARQEYPRSLGDRLLPRLVRSTYPRADRLLAVSRGAADSLAAILSRPANTVGVLYNGVDLASITRQAAMAVDHPWFADKGSPLLISVGRLVPQKGYDQLIHALALLRESMSARLTLLGEGSERSRLEALAREVGVGDSVAFLGYQVNPYAYMAEASAFVLSSRFEGFGIVLVEALACGLPVVATDCPSGPREILDNGRYGVLTPTNDPSALAETLRKLLSDPGRMAAFRAKGPQRAADFSVTRAADTLMTLLHEL